MATLSPLARLSKAREQWLDRFLKKRGPLNPPVCLEYRQIFILPTMFGFSFGLLLALLGMAVLNFNSNLGLLLVFMLAAICQVTLHLAFRNLHQLNVDSISAGSVFAGQAVQLGMRLSAADGRPRSVMRVVLNGNQEDCVDVPADGHANLHVEVPTEQRGWMPLPRLQLQNRFPLGLFRAWSWITPQSNVLVWPRPHEDAPPLPVGGQQASGIRLQGDGDELKSLREYTAGDPINRIAWKISARHEKTYAMELSEPRSDEISLNWHDAPGADNEERISVLCRWVLEADISNRRYRLSVPGFETLSDQSNSHRIRCLNILAELDL